MKYLIALLLALPLLGSQAPPAQEHGTPAPAGLVGVEQCSGRFVGPFGEFLPAGSFTRTFDGLGDLSEIDELLWEDCFALVYRDGAENTAPFGEGSVLFTNQHAILHVFVNGLQFELPLLPVQPMGQMLAPFDGLEDENGPSGFAGLTTAQPTGHIFTIVLTPALRAAFANDFQITIITQGDSTVDLTGGVHGSADYFWRGGVAINAVVPAP